MKSTPRLLLLLLYILIFNASFLKGQDLNIQCTSTLVGTLNLGTGVDANGGLIAPAIDAIDPLWSLTNLPQLNFCTGAEKAGISTKAYLVNFNNFGPAAWTNQTDVTAISPINSGLNAILNCSNIQTDSANQKADPFVFERYFCLDQNAEVELDLTFKGDDRLRLELVNLNNGNIEASSQEYKYANPAPAALSFKLFLGLQAGNYALRANYENFGVAGAFSVKGTISVIGGQSLLSNGLATVNLLCTVSDTLTTDQYYYYPDSALTICADTTLLPSGKNYSFQWFDAAGNAIVNFGPSNQRCLDIPILNQNTTGLYFCVVQLDGDDRCFVLPVEVGTYVQDPTGAWYIPNQLVVKYRTGTTEQEKLDYINKIQATRLDSCMCLLDLLMLPDTLLDEFGNPIVDPEEKKKKAGSDDNAGVETVGWNTIMEEEALALDARADQQQRLNKSVALKAFEETTNGDSVIVALIDTGFDYTNPAFQDYIWKNPEPYPMSTDSCKACITGAEIGYDFGDDDNDPSDNNLHGTFVGQAIIYAAEALSDGTIPKLKIMPLKVMDDHNTITVFNVTCATIFAVRHGAMIINMSMGGYGGYQDILAAGLATVDSGMCAPIVVTSAGNDTLDNMLNSHYFSNLNDSLLNVVSVGSIRNLPIDGFDIAPYTNYGMNVDLALTGEALFPTAPITNVAGTSISAGYASGVLAFMYEQKPGMSWSSAKQCLLSVASGKGVPGFPNNSGLNFSGRTGIFWKGELLEHLFDLPQENCEYTNQVCFPLVVSTKNKPFPRTALAVKVVPNPTSGEIQFELTLSQAEVLKFQVYDLQGKLVSQFERRLGAGVQQVPYTFMDQPSGVYFYTILSNQYIQSGKIIKQR